MSGAEIGVLGDGLLTLDGEPIGKAEGVTIWVDEVSHWTDEDWQRVKASFKDGFDRSVEIRFGCDFGADDAVVIVSGVGGGKTLRQEELHLQQIGRAVREDLVKMAGPLPDRVGIWEKPQANRRRFKRNARRQRK